MSSNIVDRCTTPQASQVVNEICLNMVDALKVQLGKTHRCRSNMLGKLLLLVSDIRILTHIYLHNLSWMLMEFEEVVHRINPVLKELMHPDGQAYENLSAEFISKIYDGATLEETKKEKCRGTEKKRKNKKDKLKESSTLETSAQSGLQKRTLNFQDFHFFTPPESDTAHGKSMLHLPEQTLNLTN